MLNCSQCSNSLEHGHAYCKKCARVIDLDKLNYFEMFNIESAFIIDQLNLEKQYLGLMKIFHPDLFIIDHKIKQDVTRNSILINEAYKTLKNDHSRLVYLLGLHNYDILSDENSPDQDLLFYEMKRREDLEDCIDLEKVSLLLKQSMNERHILLKTIDQEFQLKNYDKIMYLSIKLKYIDNFIKSIKVKKLDLL